MSFLGVFERKGPKKGLRIVELLHSVEHGEDVYAFVAVAPEHYMALRAQVPCLKSLPDYAEELLRGVGRNPPLDTIRQVREKYGIHHDVTDGPVRRAMARIFIDRRTSGDPLCVSQAARW